MVKYKLIRQNSIYDKLKIGSYTNNIKDNTVCIVYNPDGTIFSNSFGWYWVTHYPEYWKKIEELSLLEEAKLRYPIGTKFKNALQYRNDNDVIFKITSTDKFYQSTVESHGCVGVYFDNEWLYYNNQWAEIVDDFVLPEKWCIKRNNDNHIIINKWFRDNNYGTPWNRTCYIYIHENKKDYRSTFEKPLDKTEITFEQFKKYVLKEETSVEKDYEILTWYSPSGRLESKVHSTYDPPHTKIHSIKRLSDSQIFTIGDNIKNNEIIKSIQLIDNQIRIYPQNSFYYLKDIVKIKQPLFTTEDGVDIFKGDNIYGVKFYIGEHELKSLIANDKDVLSTFLRFSTKEKAEEYILMNKPLLSLSDVWDNLKVKDQKEVMKFVKSKLNI